MNMMDGCTFHVFYSVYIGYDKQEMCFVVRYLEDDIGYRGVCAVWFANAAMCLFLGILYYDFE